MGELDARILAGEKVVEGKLPGSWPKVKTVPDTRLTGGEMIGSLEVVPTPGHSPGHVAFRDTRDGTAIAGDVFTSLGGVAVSNHFYFRFPFGPWRPGTRPRTSSQPELSEASTRACLSLAMGPRHARRQRRSTRRSRGPNDEASGGSVYSKPIHVGSWHKADVPTVFGMSRFRE
jgi:hypothetical protein